MIRSEELRRRDSFFALGHWGCAAFVVLLVVVALVTAGQAVLMVARPISELTGTFVALDENKTSGGRIAFVASIETNTDSTVHLTVNNYGRIHRYLQTLQPGSLLDVRHARGQLLEVQAIEPVQVAVKENAAPASLLLAVTIMSLGLAGALSGPYAFFRNSKSRTQPQ